MAFSPSDRLVLPTGLDFGGSRYREIVIDKMRGFDEERVADPKIKNNGAKALTAVLSRCIQEIPGLVAAKARSSDPLDDRYVRAMYTVDRDFLFMAVKALAVSDHTFTSQSKCPSCGGLHQEEVDLTTLDVFDWPEDQPAEVELEMKTGFEHDGRVYPKVTWKFLTGNQQESLAAQPVATQGTATIAACVKEARTADGEHKMRPDQEMVRRLLTEDRTSLLRDAGIAMPGLDLRRQLDCGDCSRQWEGFVNIANFFSAGSAGERKTTPAGSPGPKKLLRR